MTGKLHAFLALAILLIVLAPAAGCKRPVDCRKVTCYEPVACCAGGCSDPFDRNPPPARNESECCSCRGSVVAYNCPSQSRCFREWQQYTLKK